MKNAFSLLELIFAIVVIGIISSFAIPKYMDIRNQAMASTIQRDIVTATTSIQSYYLVNRGIENISDAISLNDKNWIVTDLKATFKDGDSDCVYLEVKQKEIAITIYSTVGDVCKELDELGIKTLNIELI